MQNFRALGAPPPDPRASGGWGLCPQTPSLRQLGASPPHPHWPPAAGGSAPRPPKQPPPLRISGYAPDPNGVEIAVLAIESEAIGIWWYPRIKSILEKMRDPVKRELKS